jgi:hypothetical protein
MHALVLFFCSEVRSINSLGLQGINPGLVFEAKSINSKKLTVVQILINLQAHESFAI